MGLWAPVLESAKQSAHGIAKPRPGKLGAFLYYRRLICESLEDRYLLSVASAQFDLVNASSARYALLGSGDYTETVVDDGGSADISSSSRAVAGDDDGDFVVVWTANGKVNMRLVGSDDTVIASSALTTTNTNQSATVAMNATGDFVVVWETKVSSTDWDVYAQLFDALGNEVTDPFVVTTTSGSQRNPAVAMDDYGNFVVTWVAAGTSVNEVHAQLFNYAGQTVGEEIEVNEQNLPGGSLSVAPSVHPTVAMSGTGSFVVAWELSTKSGSVLTDSVIVGRLFDSTGAPAASGTVGEFAISSGATPFLSDATHTPQTAATGGTATRHRARNPQATMADDGSFVVSWEAYQDNDTTASTGADSYGIYFQRFDSTADAVLNSDHQANMVVTKTTAVTTSDRFAGDQLSSSVAMDSTGNYVVVWSGSGAESTNGSSSTGGDATGVWLRTFAAGAGATAEYTSGQERVNITSVGTQDYPTVAMTPSGDKIAVWSSTDAGGDTTIYYRRYTASMDIVGPIATELRVDAVDTTTSTTRQTLVPDGANLSTDGTDANGITVGNVNYVYVIFDEELLANSTTGTHSVTNPGNWVLTGRDGTVIQKAIKSVEVIGKPGSSIHKWEYKVNFNGSLPDGGYILIARDKIYDASGNPLSRNGYRPEAVLTGGADPTSQAATRGFGFHFFVNQPQANEAGVGNGADQSTGISAATGAGTEQSTQSVAISDSGSYVVAWTSVDADGDRNIRMKLYGDTGAVLASGIVNTTPAGSATAGDRKLASVAMDADGDFIVAWEGYDYNSTTASWDWNIYARRYDAKGNATISDTDGDGLIEAGEDTADEFVVNTASGGNQLNPTVAADNYGNFVVAWVNAGSGGNRIEAQLFDYRGRKRGDYFQVNQQSLPSSTTSTNSVNVNPSAAMSGTGEFVIVWDRVTAQSNGVDTNSAVVGRAFDRTGVPIVPTTPIAGTTSEFQVSLGTVPFISDATHTPQTAAAGGSALRHAARNPDVAMTDNGMFTVTWEAYEDNDNSTAAGPESYGVYYRRFGITTTTTTTGTTTTVTTLTALDHQANLVVTTTIGTSSFAGDQVNAAVAVADQGNYIIVWNGAGAVPNATDATLPPTSIDDEGVWLRTFVATSAGGAEYAAGQQRVNTTQAGAQEFASVAMTPDGEAVVVWLSTDSDGSPSLKARRYAPGQSDLVGPQATELRLDSYNNVAKSDRDLVADGDNIETDDDLKSLIVVFNEDMESSSTNGSRSVTNPNNWVLTRGSGTAIQGAVSGVAFAHNSGTNKWEARVTFNATLFPNGLDDGSYILIVRDVVADVAGNLLARSGYRPEGASADNGGGNDPTVQYFTAGFGFRFGVNSWAPTAPSDHAVDRHVATSLTTATATANPTAASNLSISVARNARGDTVVVWLQYVTTGASNNVVSPVVYAQLFDADGHALHSEPEVQMQPKDPNTQGSLTAVSDPVVAIDAAGHVLIVYAGTPSYPINAGDDTDATGIYGMWFDSRGDLVGKVFRINQYTGGTQSSPSVACDEAGDFVVTWTSSNPGAAKTPAHPDEGGIYARFYDYLGAALSAEIPVNSYTNERQEYSSVAMDADGDVVAVWQSYGQDGSSWGVYGQRFTRSGTKKGSEFKVNTYTTNAQQYPDVAMDRDGDFVVAWQSFGQDGSSSGIYAQRFNNSGAAQGSEFKVNVTTAGAQEKPAVALRRSSDSYDGDFVITWTSTNQEPLAPNTQGVFAGMFNANGTPFMLDGAARSEFRVNALVAGNQWGSDAAMDASGDYVVGWLGPDSSGTGVYTRFLDPPGNRSLVYADEDSPVLRLTGTSGTDTIVITAGATLGSWTVTVNGVAQSVPATTTTINVDGLAGLDAITLTLTSSADTVDLSATSGTITGALGYSISLSNLENVTIDGKGGADAAILRDTSGNDIFSAQTNLAEHKASGYSQVLKNFPTITAYGGTGTDTANLYGSTGSDTFTAEYGSATMTSSLGYRYQASGFTYQYGYGVTGGTDTATITGSEGADVLTANPSQAMLSDGQRATYAKSFATVTADGRGGKDTARLSDSSGNDLLTASSTQVQLKAPSFTVLATGFETVTVTASTGYDTAQLTDAAGNNTFTATPTKAMLTSSGYSLTANKFDYVNVGKVYGSIDAAYLYDSKGNDTFISTPSYAMMSGSGYVVRVKGFNSSYAYSTSGGTDVAKLYGSTGADTLEATNQYVRLYGAKYAARAKSFKQVYVYGCGGTDQGTLTDAVLTQGNLAVASLPSSYTEALWMSNFKTFTLKNSTTGTQQTITAVDTVYTAYW